MATPMAGLDQADSLEQQAYLVGLKLQRLELSLPADDRPDNTQITFDTEANTVNVSLTLDTILNIAEGNAVITAKPYID